MEHVKYFEGKGYASEPSIIVVEVTVEYHAGRSRPPYPRNTYFCKPTSRLTVLRPGICNNAVCEAHARELAPTTHVCRAHWSAWQEVVA